MSFLRNSFRRREGVGAQRGSDLVLEVIATPFGAVVELQPPLRIERRLFWAEGEESRMNDRIARANETVIAQRSIVSHDAAVDVRGCSGKERDVLTGVRAHVALLAGDAFFGGGRGPVLFPNGFELDTGIDRDLVASDAELRLLEHVRLDGCLVHADPLLVVGIGRSVGLVGIDEDPVLPRAADGLDAAHRVERAEDRLVDGARRDAPRAVGLAVCLADAVAGHAGDAFLRGRGAVPPGDGA